MDWLGTFFISVAMACDCMCVGATDGIQEPKMKKIKAVLIAFSFGLFQMMMPEIGYLIGHQFEKQLEVAVPWIGFSLLVLLGIKSLFEWGKDFRKYKQFQKAHSGEDAPKPEEKTFRFVDILVQSIATSIDALCVGFSYLDRTPAIAWGVFGMIGGVTALLSLIAIFTGKKIGLKLIRWAGLISGIVFLIIGIRIPVEEFLIPALSKTSSSSAAALLFSFRL